LSGHYKKITTTHIFGYPRIGEKREMTFAKEFYWENKSIQAALVEQAWLEASN